MIRLKRYPTTYNNQPLALASLPSQKRYMTVHLNNITPHSVAAPTPY